MKAAMKAKPGLTKLTLGPVLFNWAPEKWRDFYLRIADEAPVDSVSALLEFESPPPSSPPPQPMATNIELIAITENNITFFIRAASLAQ